MFAGPLESDDLLLVLIFPHCRSPRVTEIKNFFLPRRHVIKRHFPKNVGQVFPDNKEVYFCPKSDDARSKIVKSFPNPSTFYSFGRKQKSYFQVKHLFQINVLFLIFYYTYIINQVISETVTFILKRRIFITIFEFPTKKNSKINF